MSVMMDLIFSVMVGGVIILIILNANSMLRNTWSQYNNDLAVQEMLVLNAQVVESEFRNMGYGVDTNLTTIVEAKDTSIQFKMSLFIGAAPSLIKYYSGNRSELTNTPNPNDRFLYRQVDANPAQRVGMITQFRLVYLTQWGDTVPTPVTLPSNLKSIKMVEITMEVQTPMSAVQDTNFTTSGQALYSTALWKQTRLTSQNLRR